MKQKFRKYLLFAVFGAAVFVFYRIVHCPIRFLTGLPCPGCGMTRAALSLLSLDFESAWNYHPLVYIMPFAAIYLILRKTGKLVIPKKTENVLLFFVAALFLAVYVIRLISGDDVVYADFKGSVLYKIITIIGGLYND